MNRTEIPLVTSQIAISGYKGVIKAGAHKWEACIQPISIFNRKKIYIGTYDTPQEAARARQEFILNLL